MKEKIGKSYLTEIPHEGKEIVFQYPAVKGTFWKVAEELNTLNLIRPNSKEIASLVYDAWKNPKGKYESEIMNLLNDSFIWEFTGNLYLPKSNGEISNGVILEHNPKIENGKLVMDKNSLIKRLCENDSSVKFVPFGFKTGEQNLLEFAHNSYIISRYGEEGAEKIAEVASKYENHPFVWSFNSIDKKEIKMSTLSSYRTGGRLDIGGDIPHNERRFSGHSFGISEENGINK